MPGRVPGESRVFPWVLRTLPLPPVREREVLRYAGCREAEESTLALLQSCLRETEELNTASLLFLTAPGDALCLPEGKTVSLLASSDMLCLFACTLGMAWDRLIRRYSHLSPARALMLQALGTERLESCLDGLTGADLGCPALLVRRRISPGYGDFPLEFQRELFRFLPCTSALGLTLSPSLLMTPSKSVTGVMGLSRTGADSPGCSACHLADCSFRRS